MPLEVATYINGLDSANPAATDAKSQGDDHLRLIKSAVKNTFPNLTAPVTKTAAQINNLAQAGVNTDITSIAGNASTASSAQGPIFATAIAGAGSEANFSCKVAGQSDALFINNATRWGLFSNAGGLALEYNRTSAKFVFYGKAATLGSGGAGGTEMTFGFTGQSGQPLWVWGSNTGDGSSCLVWNPANFNVNYAATAGYASSAGGTIGVSQSWQDVTGSRAANTSYYNTTGRPIMVSVICTGPDGGPVLYIEGIRIASTGNPGGTTGNDHNTVCGIVPNGSGYYINMLAQSVAKWLELR